MAKLPVPLSNICRLELPTLDESADLFKRTARATKSRLDLKPVAFPQATLRKIFDMAIKHVPPFVAEGKNFQDAVIVNSVLEFSQKSGLSAVAFVSSNRNDFSSKTLADLASNYGVRLRYYENIGQIQDELLPFWQKLLVREWERQNETAKLALKSAQADLEKFLSGQPIKSADVSLEVLEIDDMRVAWFENITKKLERIPFEARVTVRFRPPGGGEIDRGMTVNGWAGTTAEGYGDLEFESAFISR